MADTLFLTPFYVALLTFSLTFVEIYLAPLAFSLTFVEIYLALLAPPLTLVMFYPVPLPRPQCPTRQRRSTAPPYQTTGTAYLCTRKLHKYAFPAPRPPLSKMRAAHEKIRRWIFSREARSEKKAASAQNCINMHFRQMPPS